jgi:hypothetical protein
MNNLPKTNAEVLDHLKVNGATDNQIRFYANQMGEDFDDHYDIMEPKQKNEEVNY